MDDLIKFLRARLDEDEAAAVADEDRVLRDVIAKRAIVADYEAEDRDLYRAGLAFALEQLAIVYDDHPDYRQEWKP